MQPLRIWFDPPHVRWGRVALTVLAATGLIGLWVAQSRGMLDAAPVPATAAAGAAATTSTAPARAASSAIGAIASVAAPAPARAASSAEIVCGLGAVSFDPSDEQQVERVANEAMDKLAAHRDRVLPGWIEEMKSSADVQLQAGGLFLEVQREWARSVEAGQSTVPADSLGALAQLAVDSRDPLPYSLAFQACETFRGKALPPACGALRPEAWADRDPGNAFPWLVAAGRQGIDAQQRSLFLERALSADEVRGGWGVMHGVLAKAALPGESKLDRSARLHEAMSAGGLQLMPPTALTAHCGESELRFGARRTQCERLAALLMDRSDSYLLRSFGRGIGRGLGWSKDRLDSMQREQESLQAFVPGFRDMSGCDGLARAETYFADVARYGEIGALRRRQQAAQAATTAGR